MAYQMTKADLALLERESLAPCRSRFENACAASRMHSRAASDALATYGDHGAAISGCVRAHFPEAVKAELRGLASLVTYNLDKARGVARPKGARMATVNRLGRLVATRDGSGFYGPQPLRSA